MTTEGFPPTPGPEDSSDDIHIEGGTDLDLVASQLAASSVNRLKEKETSGDSSIKLNREIILSALRDHVRFRLLGYSLIGEELGVDNDMEGIVSLEEHLALNPTLLKADLAQLRAIATENSRKFKRPHDYNPDKDAELRKASALTYFEQFGGHIGAQPKEVLQRIRREGWIILAGLVSPSSDAFHPIGYNFGLDSMPKSDGEFPNWSAETLNIRSEMDQEPFQDLSRITVNARTGVLRDISKEKLEELGIHIPLEGDKVPLRRLGIGSSLKYIITRLAHLREKQRMVFNIGTIADYHDQSIKLRNAPSFQHNVPIFPEDYGYRQMTSEIMIKKPHGVRDHVARVYWRARGGPVEDAINELSSKGAVLMTRGWDIDDLEHTAMNVHMQIRDEAAKGDHM